MLKTNIISTPSFGKDDDVKTAIEILSPKDRMASLSGLHAALNAANVALVVFDADEKLLFCTEEYISLNSDIGDFIVPGVSFKELCTIALKTRVVKPENFDARFEERYRRFKNPEGIIEEQHSNGRWYSLQDFRTSEDYYIGIRKDITLQKNSLSEDDGFIKRFDVLAELATDFFWEMNANLRFNKFYGGGSKYPHSVVLNKKRWETATAQDLKDDEKWNHHKSILMARKPFRNFEYETMSDQPLWLQVSGDPIFDQNGDFQGYFGTTRDVTKKKQDEKRLQESEIRYRTLIDGSMQGVFVHFRDKALYVNKAAADLIGYSVDEIYSIDRLSPMIAAESREDNKRHLIDLWRGFDVPRENEVRWITKDGNNIYIRQASQIIDWNGKPAIQTTMVDITNQKRAEATSKEHEQRIRLITNGLPSNIAYLGEDRRFRFANFAFLEFYGKEIEEILGTHVKELMGDEAYSIVESRLDLAYAGETQNFEIEIPFEYAGNKQVNASYIPHADDDGNVLGIYAIIQDITDKKEAEQLARDAEMMLSRMLAIAPYGVVAVDMDLNIKVFNNGAERIFGHDRSDILGKSLNILIPERFHNSHKQHVSGFVTGEIDATIMSDRREILGIRKNGIEFPAEASISKLKMDNEVILTVLLHDISDRKLVQDELITAKERAEYADRTKSEFLANMSHELRTPLNAIIGFAEIMSRETFGPLGCDHYKEYTEDIYDSGKHLLSLINDILDLSKIEANQKELSITEIHIPSILEECLRLVQARANETGLEICIETAKNFPLLSGDERALRQMLLNLLSNAIKFTKSGGRISVSSVITDEGSMEIKIADTGIGIAKKDISKAMMTFGQVDSALNRKFEGTGLGLPLVKSLAELHNGGIILESKLDVGTTATIWFPKEIVVPPVLS